MEDNVYHDAFLQVPGMNRKKMNKLARHYLKQIRDKKYIHAVMIRSGILYPAYKELNDHIESGNFAMARTMLSDFGLSPVQEYVERDLALAPVITAAISEKGEQVLKMILEKLGEGANPVLACSLEMQKCGKRRIPSRCTPMAAALAADQMKNATLIMNRGGKAYWSPKQCPGELKGLVTSERPSAEFSLTKK